MLLLSSWIHFLFNLSVWMFVSSPIKKRKEPKKVAPVTQREILQVLRDDCSIIGAFQSCGRLCFVGWITEPLVWLLKPLRLFGSMQPKWTTKPSHFQPTRWTLILEAADADSPQALEAKFSKAAPSSQTFLPDARVPNQ